MTLVLNGRDVIASTDMSLLVARISSALADQARGAVDLPDRVNLNATDGFFRLMPAVMRSQGVMGFKAFNGSKASGVRYLIALYNEADGELLALIDAAYLTAARTGATSAVATKHCANPEAATVGIIGAGLEAKTNLEGICSARAIRSARVFSPTPSRREKFAEEMSARLSMAIKPVDTPEAAVASQDIIVVATNTQGRGGDEIAFRGQWLEPGVHVVSIGSTQPSLREIDVETFERADIIVLDAVEQVRSESGDVLAAADVWDPAKVAELTTVVAGEVPGRRSPDDVTVFKSVGTAVQDISSALAIYETAREKGLGQDIGEFPERKTF